RALDAVHDGIGGVAGPRGELPRILPRRHQGAIHLPRRALAHEVTELVRLLAGEPQRRGAAADATDSRRGTVPTRARQRVQRAPGQAPQRARQALQASDLRLAVDVAIVTREEFVAAVAGERHG